MLMRTCATIGLLSLEDAAMLPRVREIVSVESIDCPRAPRRLRSAFCELIVFIDECGNFGRPPHVVAARTVREPDFSSHSELRVHGRGVLLCVAHFDEA